MESKKRHKERERLLAKDRKEEIKVDGPLAVAQKAESSDED